MAFDSDNKTEQPTARKLHEAEKKGQFARSQEVQTVFVLAASLMALVFTGQETWYRLAGAMASNLAHLHDQPLSHNSLPRLFIKWVWLLVASVGPVVLFAVAGALVAGSLQSRFRTASEVLEVDWNRVNPVPGFKRLLSLRSIPPLILNLIKLSAIVILSYSEVKKVVGDPIFYTTVDAARISTFMAESAVRLALRVGAVLVLIAAIDYVYQYWRTLRDLMMTKEEVKEEMKNTEGNPQIKAAQRRRRVTMTLRKMYAEVPKADVVVTNPTHLAIALRYDRRSMRAPKILAKGARLKAQRIREIAQQHQIPIVESKPLARLLFKHGRVGGEIPAELYAAVAEILAWVYRTYRYRYYTESGRLM
ncbi:EscU/YscU/HrcU family type III secretion system export apparatus switch protein [Fontisphaera persica]|uniref:EscU/YscU/HrcU family type III secretion system export apparatus switch protein n=1 Tax=Fontisphaera persica TaxID=2974023 RepID=UPI0024C01674|nr:EscU/YscU/HrcU family type III secretion system export apparatus switch protein [Fontisphaera persica]WCJ58214.1 EscU/YscU/HrcU family type III secretion system export apparatus switch protein [Fontisphaera persica]